MMKRTVILATACALLVATAVHRRVEAQDARVRALILVGSFAAGAIIGSTGVQAKKREKEEAAKKQEALKASLALQEFARRLDASNAAAKEAEEAKKRSELLSSFAKGRVKIDPQTSIYNSELWKNPGKIKGFDIGTRPPTPAPTPQFKLPDSFKTTSPPMATPPQFKLPNTNAQGTTPPAPQFKLPDRFKTPATTPGSLLAHNLYTTQSTFYVYKLGTGWRTTAQHCITFGSNSCYPCDLRPGVGPGAANGQCVMRLGEQAIDMGSGKLSR
jgi:hypothetical protein